MAVHAPDSPAVAVLVPVTVTIGDTELELGAVRVEPGARPAQVRAAVANLLRTSAHLAATGPDGGPEWPRQAWWTGDTVTLPGSVARGTVVQVDRNRRRYLVDSGRGPLVPVAWSAVDRLASPSKLPADAVVASVLAYGATGE